MYEAPPPVRRDLEVIWFSVMAMPIALLFGTFIFWGGWLVLATYIPLPGLLFALLLAVGGVAGFWFYRLMRRTYGLNQASAWRRLFVCGALLFAMWPDECAGCICYGFGWRFTEAGAANAAPEDYCFGLHQP